MIELSAENKKTRPAPMRQYDQQELKLAIKSSLPNVKSTLALLILIWESLDSPSEVVYSRQNNATIVLADDIKQAIITTVSEICHDENVDLKDMLEKINENQLFKSQLESLIVALELIWKLSSIRFVDDDRTTLERTGGKRFAKKLSYSSNIDIVHCLITNNRTAYFKVLLAWIGIKIQFNDKIESTLTNILSILSEGAVFKLIDGNNPVIFNQNSLYLKLLESQSEVDINGDSEVKGTLRILKSLLSDKLNPYLTYSSGSVGLNSDVKKLQNYQRRVDTFLRLSAIKNFENEDTIISDSKLNVSDDVESDRLSTGENILLYGVPGAGKSWIIAHEYCKEHSKVERLVFHPDYTYAEFIGQILPDVRNGEVTYDFSPGPFTRILRDAYQNPGDEYILIIEEINRGNAPAIFGEVFQLLDRMIESKSVDGITYPAGTSEYDISNRYMAIEIYGDGNHKIRIPSNLSIIGTMNTSDQNVFTLDTAFQRRWNMRLIENSFNNVRSSLANAEILDTGVTWQHFCETINRLIIANKNKLASAEDKRLGVYFVHEKDLKYSNVFDDYFQEKLLSDEYSSLLVAESESTITDEEKKILEQMHEMLKNLSDEYDELLVAESNSTITDDQKKTLEQMRKMLKQNRKFAEKVIKYLWDDAFKFNTQDLFDNSFSSLESVIRHFVFSSGKKRLDVFNQSVRELLLKK